MCIYIYIYLYIHMNINLYVYIYIWPPPNIYLKTFYRDKDRALQVDLEGIYTHIPIYIYIYMCHVSIQIFMLIDLLCLPAVLQMHDVV